MFRYNFSAKSVKQGIDFVQGKQKAKPSFLTGRKGSVKKGRLFINDKEVIASGKVESFIRDKILSATVPLARDSLYYFFQQKYINVPRAKIDKILKAQSVIRETDNRQPTTTQKKRKVHKKGQLSFDLVEIKFKDLPFTPTDPDIEVNKGYFFGCVDQLTGLSYFEFTPHKDYENITPVAEKCFKWFSEKLGVPMSKLVGLSDKGGEFDFVKYKQWGLRLKQLPRAPLIEAKNAGFQRVLYRIAKMNKTRKLKKLTAMAMKILNDTQSTLTKKTPNENLDEQLGTLAEKYNKKRKGKGTDSAVKAKGLKLGDMVRLAITPEKDKLEYKAYKGIAWTKAKFKVLAKRGNTYKIYGPEGKKFYHRDKLRLTAESDKISDAIIAGRKKTYLKKDIKREDEIAAEVTEQKTNRRGRPMRKSAQKGVAKRLKAKKKMRAIDEFIVLS